MIHRLTAAALCGLIAATAAGQEPEPVVALRVYDVRDLLKAPRDFPPMQLGVKRNLPPAPAASEPPGADEAMAALTARLKQSSGAEWPEAAGVEGRGGSLVIRQTAAGHASVAGWLAGLRAARNRMVSVEARFIALESELAKKLPRGLHVIDASQAKRMLELARKKERATILTAPKITAFENQLANIVVANQVSYISHLEVTVKRSVIVADPVIDTVSDGVVLAVRARGAEAGWLRAELDIQAATLLRPMPELKTRYGTVQVPELVSQRLQLTGRIPDGGWALCAGLVEVKPDGASGRPVVVLVRLQSVTAPAPRGK